jgi:O-glycosyl hydrolase
VLPAVTVVNAIFAQVPVSGTAAKTSSAPQSILIDGRNGGRRFDGVGAVSAGASTRLLYDYPEPARSQILDYLFKPGYGANLQILKVEIGSDVNATDGSEPSHMRTRDDLNFARGYEWWLMKEARARNPEIKIAALSWGAPGWLKGGFWSQDNVDYIVKWLDGAKHHGIRIDYAGGWNESGYEARWFVLLDKALKQHHPEVRIIAPDDLPQFNWRIADDMASDPEVDAAIDVIGQHSPGGWRSLYEKYSSTDAARRTGKPLWTSEQSALSHDVGAGPWARSINRAYIDAKITASINWAPVSAWYAHLPHADTGLLLAEWPWSGYYQVGSSVWTYAHTTQFLQPGWEYIDSASGYLASGASYVTAKDPASGHFSLVIETMDAKVASAVRFTLTGGLDAETIHVWSTNVQTATSDDDFVHSATIHPRNGTFTVLLEPGHVYTITSTTGQMKGKAASPGDVVAQLPLPFVENFERYKAGMLARYFSDNNGGFETVRAGAGRNGMAYRQMVTMQPISWHLAGGASSPPTTIVGDPRWWGDYELRADVLLEQNGYVELIGRISAQAARSLAGYHLQFNSAGTWRLYSQELGNVRKEDVEIAGGRVSFPAGVWHTIALRMRGDTIEAVLDTKVVGSAVDGTHTSGNVAFRVSGWQNAQFDNVSVTRTAAAPDFVSVTELTATAGSVYPGIYRGDVFKASYAVDGRPESYWRTDSASTPRLPQAITIDVGRLRPVQALTYQPRLDDQSAGMITKYSVAVSTDGRTFSEVGGGAWPVSTATKVARWPVRQARYVRLTALDGVGGIATAGEIGISSSPIRVPEPGR